MSGAVRRRLSKRPQRQKRRRGLTLDIRTLYMMNAVMYLMLHGIIWVSLSRQQNPWIKPWSLGGIVSAFGVFFLGCLGVMPDWVVAIFGQTLMAIGNFIRQYVLLALSGQASRRWLWGRGLFNLAYLSLNGTLFFWGASYAAMMVVFFAFYAVNCLDYFWAGRAMAQQADAQGGRSVQWSGLVLSLSLGIKGLSVWAGWGAKDIYGPGWDQMVLFAGQFLAISLMNFGFMQFLVGQFQRERLRAEQHAQALSQLLRGREDILRQLTLSNKSAGMGALVSSMAHEVNQPLTTIVLKTELIDSYLMGVDVAPQVRDLLQQIRNDTHHAGSMIRTLRNMFNRGNSDFGPLDFSALLRDVVGMVQSHAQRRGVEVFVDAPETATLVGDATQLQQVLLNLLNNAIQSFAGQSVTQARVSLQCQQLGDWLELRVQDNGCGIEAAAHDDVFALIKSPPSRGMGVGLWLSLSVVENHGGTLEFSSTPGQGTVFVLRLPVSAPALVS